MTNSEALERLRKLNAWLGDHESEAIRVAISALETITPNWGNAPEWAQWRAVDKNGSIYWYSKKPRIGDYEWIEYEGRCASVEIINWRESLERRP